jgi:hypothetical protein
MVRFRFHCLELPALFAAVALAVAACGAPRSIYDLDESQIDYNETVPLHFDWPAGVVAQVQSSVQKTETVGKVVTTKGGHILCTMHTESADDGITVQCGNATINGDEVLQVIMDGAPGLLVHPVLTVDAHGTITKIEGLHGVRGALVRALAGEPKMLTNRRGLIDILSDPETVTRVADREWSNLITFWAGKSLKTGTTYDLNREAAVPVQNEMIDWVQQYRLAGRVPCNEWEEARRCVKLVLTSTPDSTQFNEAVKDIMKNVMAGAHMHRSSTEVVLRKVQYRYTLVTTPERLLPYWVENRRSMQLETARTDGKSEIMDVVEERHDSYEYFAIGKPEQSDETKDMRKSGEYGQRIEIGE